MAGSHRAGGAQELRLQIQEMVIDLEAIIASLGNARADMRTVGTRVLAIHAGDNDVSSAGGALLNQTPQGIDEIIKVVQLHIRTLEVYMSTVE